MTRSALPDVLRKLADAGGSIDIDTEDRLRDVADRLEQCEDEAHQTINAIAAADLELRGAVLAEAREAQAAALDTIRTLRDYIAAPEGAGPVRYIEALDLADAALDDTGAPDANQRRRDA